MSNRQLTSAGSLEVAFDQVCRALCSPAARQRRLHPRPAGAALKPIDRAALQAWWTRRPGAPGPRRRGSPAHAPGRRHRQPWHHAIGPQDSTRCRHAISDRVEHEDHDGGGGRATGAGGQARPRRSGREVRPERAQRREHHRRPAPRDAEQPPRLHGCTGAVGSADREQARVWTRMNCWRSRSRIRPASRRVRPTRTATPTTCCSASSSNASMAGHSPSRCTTDCSVRWACNTPPLPASTVTTIPNRTRTATCTAAPLSPWRTGRSILPKSSRGPSRHSLPPTDFTGLNHSFAAAAGVVISTADDLATWIRALVTGRVFDARVSTPVARQPAAGGPEQAGRPTVQVRHLPTALGTEHDLFSRRRDPRLATRS